MPFRLHLALAAALLAAAAIPSTVTAQSADDPAAAPAPIFPEVPPGARHGYLDETGLPDSLALLPPPPAPGSPGFARDEAIREAAAKQKGDARWERAVSDADLDFPHAADTFSCAGNLRISQERMPHLYTLLGRVLVDVGRSTSRAKHHYERVRPFALHNAASCTPTDEEFLRKDGSYPSGHSAAGWGWALLMTEILPEHTDAILARGWDFGESRIVCNVHWQSDVDAGRVMASATLARLHAVPAFRADIEAAKSEVEAARAEGAEPDADASAAEAASLAWEP